VLSHNHLTELPPEIGQLRGLWWLSLSHNQFTQLPPELGQLTETLRLDLSNNPRLVSPPPEVIEQGTEAVLAYLRRK
jgi:Leucine-rich repeat (LRR) protein